jgi:hypothetical protein
MALLGKYTKVFIFKPQQTAHNRFDKYLGTITKVLQNLSLTKKQTKLFQTNQRTKQKSEKYKRKKKKKKSNLGRPGVETSPATQPEKTPLTLFSFSLCHPSPPVICLFPNRQPSPFFFPGTAEAEETVATRPRLPPEPQPPRVSTPANPRLSSLFPFPLSLEFQCHTVQISRRSP